MRALTKRIEFEIRMRFELREDLNKLAAIYRISLSTLNKRKKIAEIKGDPWIKGSRSKSAYETFIENDKERRKELREQINKDAREEMKKLKEEIENADVELENDDLEKSIILRMDRIDKFLDLRKKIEEIPTMKEEVEIEKMKIDIELKRKELQDKTIELEIKKVEAKMLLGDEK